MEEERSKDLVQQSLRRVRLERLANELGLGPPEKLRNKEPQVPDMARQAKSLSTKDNGRKAASGKGQKTSAARVMTSQDMEAEIILRRLIAMESSWDDMKPYAWEIFSKWPTAEIAGKMVELAYLHGTSGDVFHLLNHLKTKNRAGYFTVGTDLRPYIVLKMWRSGKEGVLNHYLHQKPYLGQLLRIEKLFVFWSLFGCLDQVKSWDFFRRFADDIVSAVKEYGSQLKLQTSLLYFEIGKLAKNLGKDQDAIFYLEKIKESDKEFPEALNLLLTFKVQLDSQGYCLFGRQLIKEKDWHKRLNLLMSFLEKVCLQKGMRHRERTALNNLLAKPLKWFPESAEAWHQLSSLLAKYADLDHLLPHIFKVFKERQLEFHAPVFERALWEPLLRLESGDPYKKHYWRGLALLHRFVGQGCLDENLLWDAKEHVESSRGSTSVEDALAWDKIHNALVLWISRSAKFNEDMRQDILRRVKVVGHHLNITGQDVEAYIKFSASPRIQTIERLQSIALKRGDALVEANLILKKAQLTHFTNTDLERMWTLGRSLRNYDLSWRVASILQHRKVLSRDVEQVWILSGEKRQNQILRVLPSKLVPLLYQDLAVDDRTLAQALLMIGERIPELLSMINHQVKPAKTPRESKLTTRIFATLGRHEWLGVSHRPYSSHPEFMAFSLPPFAAVLPETPWSNVFIGIAEKLGVITWRWQLTWLHDELEGLIPKIHKKNDRVLKGRIGKWMRSLSPLQRKAWFNLVSISGKYGHEEGYNLLGKILARFAICVYQDHCDALSSLASMNVPLEIYWDLESWILSPQYSHIRKVLQTYHTYDVPAGLSSCVLKK